MIRIMGGKGGYKPHPPTDFMFSDPKTPKELLEIDKKEKRKDMLKYVEALTKKMGGKDLRRKKK